MPQGHLHNTIIFWKYEGLFQAVKNMQIYQEGITLIRHS